jgi:hypothetical protein
MSATLEQARLVYEHCHGDRPTDGADDEVMRTTITPLANTMREFGKGLCIHDF